MKILLILVGIIYIITNIFVARRINKAFYLKEEIKNLHKIFIWLMPFLGPLMIRSFWKKQKNGKIEIITKDKRKNDNISYYESGLGMH